MYKKIFVWAVSSEPVNSPQCLNTVVTFLQDGAQQTVGSTTGTRPSTYTSTSVSEQLFGQRLVRLS